MPLAMCYLCIVLSYLTHDLTLSCSGVCSLDYKSQQVYLISDSLHLLSTKMMKGVFRKQGDIILKYQVNCIQYADLEKHN
jgi:hypothetical protein